MRVLSILHDSIGKTKQQRNRRYKCQAAWRIYRGGEKSEKGGGKKKGRKNPPYAISLLIVMNKNRWLGHEGQDWQHYLSSPLPPFPLLPPSFSFPSLSLPLFSPNIPFSACPGALWNETPRNQTTALLLKLSQTPRLFDVCVSSRHLSATPAPPKPLGLHWALSSGQSPGTLAGNLNNVLEEAEPLSPRLNLCV